MESKRKKLKIAVIYWAEHKNNFKTERHYKNGVRIFTLVPVNIWWSRLLKGFDYEIFRWEYVAFVKEDTPLSITLYFPNKELDDFIEEFKFSNQNRPLHILRSFSSSSK